MSKKLADSIISLRRKHGFSQEQLAEKIGVTRQAISNWERGTATPDVETLNLIAKLLDTDLLAIINGESEGYNLTSNNTFDSNNRADDRAFPPRLS